MTVEQLVRYSATDLEDLKADDYSAISVKDIFHVLEVS